MSPLPRSQAAVRLGGDPEGRSSIGPRFRRCAGCEIQQTQNRVGPPRSVPTRVRPYTSPDPRGPARSYTEQALTADARLESARASRVREASCPFVEVRPIDLRRHHEIAFRQSIDLVRVKEGVDTSPGEA